MFSCWTYVNISILSSLIASICKNDSDFLFLLYKVDTEFHKERRQLLLMYERNLQEESENWFQA